MDWWKKRRFQAVVKKQRLARELVRGEMLLEELIECCDGKSNPIKFFSADQIIKATDNFCKCDIPTYKKKTKCDDNPKKNLNVCECTAVSGLSNYMRWYSGMLDDHRMILVDILVHGNREYPRKLCRDIAISSMVSGHKNFMKLVGCCLEFEYPVMVYYGGKEQYSQIDLKMVVSWERRMKIAEEIATALAYLHTAFSRPIIYRNMGLWNILLDENGVAKLSDFSKCVSIPQGETFVQAYAEGAVDYMDDNYLINSVVSEKTDAYGFGIFMQQLLKGETMLEKMGEVSEEERFHMEDFLLLSERCIGVVGEVPKMVQVAKELKRFLKDIYFSGET